MAEKKYLNDNGLSYLWLKLKDLFNGKVDKVEGKGLSERDFTQAYQTKLDSLKKLCVTYCLSRNIRRY